MAGALANTTTQGLLDAQLVNKRVTAGINFTKTLIDQDQGAAYSGNAAAAAVRTMLAGVTANTDASVFQSSVDSTIARLVADWISVAPTAAAGGARTALVGSAVQLGAAASGGVSYHWTLDAAPAGSIATLTAAPAVRHRNRQGAHLVHQPCHRIPLQGLGQ